MTTIDIDYRAAARAAMDLAAVATSEAERLKWVCLAIAWQDLAGEWPDHQCQQIESRRNSENGFTHDGAPLRDRCILITGGSSRRAWRPMGVEMDGVERFFAVLTVAGFAGLFASVAWMMLSGL
jgi:hypothetical protein